MNVWKIIGNELAHKKFGFITGVLSLVVATAGFVTVIVMLKADKLATEKLFVEKEKELKNEMVKLEDDYRIIMRNMGYNILIVNGKQSMADLEKNGYATKYMDYEDVWKIAESGMKTLNHLLPVLQEKIYWDEKNATIYLTGIRGQVPVYSKPAHLTEDNEYRSPIMERVPEGKADLGEEIATMLRLHPGEKITIRGEEFVVNKIYPRRGTRDDISVWIPLDRAQKILGRGNKINGILALECVCATKELGKAKEELISVLPDAKVFEFSSLIAARADVRHRAEELHKEIMAEEIGQQKIMRSKKEELASILVILLVAGASIWIFVQILNNVRERKKEIGIMRAIGFSRIQVLKIFLGKSAIMGVLAGILGAALGLFLGISWSNTGVNVLSDGSGIFPVLILGLLLAPLMALTAGFLPSVFAANQDPAVILSEE